MREGNRPPCGVMAFVRGSGQLAGGSGAVAFEEFLDFDGSHAAGSGGGDGLAIAPVLHIATREYAPDAGPDVVVRLEIAVGVGVELAGEHLRVGIVPDAEKQRAGREV